MQTRGFHHLAIQVHDLERCATFYQDVLGLTETVRHRQPDGTLRRIWLSLGEGQPFLALEKTEAAPHNTPFRHAYVGLHLLALRIDPARRKAFVEELKARAIPVEHETRWTFYVRDPEGNRIGLSHHPEDPIG